MQKLSIPAKRLAVSDCFLPGGMECDWGDGTSGWIVKSHTLTDRGDYSTFVESGGTVWSERFEPEEIVTLMLYPKEQG